MLILLQCPLMDTVELCLVWLGQVMLQLIKVRSLALLLLLLLFQVGVTHGQVVPRWVGDVLGMTLFMGRSLRDTVPLYWFQHGAHKAVTREKTIEPIRRITPPTRIRGAAATRADHHLGVVRGCSFHVHLTHIGGGAGLWAFATRE